MSPDRWLVLTVRVPSDELHDELAEGLFALGGAAVEENVDLLTTYLPEPEDPMALLERAVNELEARAGRPLEALWRWQADEDWSARWKEGLGPRRITSRLTVTQPWNPVPEEGDHVVITIDPSNAFGTGEHATTRGALRLLQAELRPEASVLDVGAGSAILSIAAARLGAGEVLAVEADADALRTAAENLARNGVAGEVELAHAVVDPAWLRAHAGPYDLVVANVLSGILVPLLPAIAAVVRPGGGVILGGIMEEEAGSVVRAAERARLAVEREDREEGWWTALFRRPGLGSTVGPAVRSTPAD